MNNINIDLNKEKIQIEKFNSTNDKFKKVFSNTMDGCRNDITALNIAYFDELEEFAKKVAEENDIYYVGSEYYVSALNNLKPKIVYKVSQSPSFKAPGNVGGERDTIPPGEEDGEYGSEFDTIPEDGEDLDDADGTGAYGSELDTTPEDGGDVGDADGPKGYGSGLGENKTEPTTIARAREGEEVIAGLKDLPTYPDEEPLDSALGGGLELPTLPDYSDTTTDNLIAAATGIQGLNLGDLSLGGNGGTTAGTFTPFGSNFDDLKGASLGGNAESGNGVESGLAGSSQDGLGGTSAGSTSDYNGNLGLINDEDINVEDLLGASGEEGLLGEIKKSGMSGGTIAGTILGAVLTGALGFGSIMMDKAKEGATGEFNLDSLNQSPTIVKDANENQEMLVGQKITTTYKDPMFQMAEYSQNFVSNLIKDTTIAPSDYDSIVKKFANEFGALSQKEIEFGMSGMPFAFEGFTERENFLLFQELASLIDHYGGIEGLLENYDEVHDYLQKVGSSYDILKNIMDLPIEEQIEALRGLFDEENPNIGGIPIPKEARDFIVEYLENATGLTLDELLSGEHNEELKHALASLLEVLKIIKAMGALSYEEFEMFLYDLLNGRFTELCGITSVNVATLKHFLNEEADNMGITYEELVSNFEFKDELKEILEDFSSTKIDFVKLIDRDNLFEIVEKILKGEEASLGIDLSSLTIDIIKKLVELYAKYCKKDLKLIMYSIGFKDFLPTLIKNIYKYAMFIGMLSKMQDESLQLRIYETFMGYWLGLLGFTVNEIGNLKKKLEEAQEKYNIELSLIVNDSNNKEALKSIVEDDDIYFRLLLIYDELSDDKLQIIIANLLKSWENEHIYDLKNLIVYANRKKLISIIDYCKGKINYDVLGVNMETLKAMIDKIYSLNNEDIYKELRNIYYRKPSIIDKEEYSMLLIYLIMIVLYALSIMYTMTADDILKDEEKKKNAYEMIKNTPYYMNYINPSDKLFDENVISSFMIDLISGKYKNLIGEANLEI